MSGTTYDKILEAAADSFSKNGFNETTMDQIAEKARVSKGALYWHFKNKEELFVKLKEQHITQVLQSLEKLFASTESFDSKLAASYELYFSSLSPQQKNAARLNMEFWAAAPRISGLNRMLNDQYNRLEAFLRSTIDGAIAKGELNKKIDSESLSTILLAILDGLELHWAILDKDFDWQKILATFCEAILNGVKSQKRSGRK